MFHKKLIKIKSSKKVLQLIKILMHYLFIYLFIYFLMLSLLFWTVKSSIPPFPFSETLQLLQNGAQNKSF